MFGSSYLQHDVQITVTEAGVGIEGPDKMWLKQQIILKILSRNSFFKEVFSNTL